MRTPTQKQRPRKAEFTSFASPTDGLISNRNLAMARGPDVGPGAEVLENWFPTATGVVLRRGVERKASIVEDDPVRSIFNYASGTTKKLFAAVSTGIRDITTVVDRNDWVGPDVLTGQTSPNWNVVQYSTAGGEFLIGVNGADDGFLYDGSTFGALSITFPGGSTLTTNDLAYVWVYKQRIWFIEKDSLNAWYLPVDSIAGELTLWPMGGVFTRGGTLTWGQAWSLDSGGAGGLSEQCVFVSTEGEVAAYQGLSPAADQGWAKVGQYRIGVPLGDKAFARAGGDIIIATTVGLVSLASASRNDYAALGQNAVSYPIEDDWARAILERGQIDWRMDIWPDKQMAIVSPPAIIGNVPMVFVINVNTGKWCKFTSWCIRSIGLFMGDLFFGCADGSVKEAWIGGTDEGAPYTGKVLPLFSDLGAPGSLKTVKTARAVVLSSFKVKPKLTGMSNFSVNFPNPPNLGIPVAGSEWDAGIWGASLWDSERAEVVISDWVPVSGYGHDLSIGMQITGGSITPADAELVRIDLTYEIGGIGT